MLKFGGSVRPEFSQVRLHEVLDHSLRLVQPKLEDNQVSLSRSFQAGADVVKGDERQLQQAFVNLLLNALDAMGQNGSLSVGTELVPPECAAGRAQLRVTIKDSGPGIPADLMGRLFEPFFTTKPNGTGLGLSITQRIIVDHQGDIRVESKPGQGTAFHILLPAAG
jgi:signal transduction histidine kinase